jgi:thioredoxin-related protein
LTILLRKFYTAMNHIFVKTILPFAILLGLITLFISKDATVAATKPENKPETAIHWLSLEEASLLAEKEKKPIFINVYAEWSSGCKKMEAETFSKPSIIEYINTHYYAVRLNAESNMKVQFDESEIGSQQLAQHIFKVNSYPSMVYINTDRVMTTVPGYQNSQDFEMYLRYFGK